MAAAPQTADEIRDVNTRYHDTAAANYDAKWGIDFGGIGQTQVIGKLAKALGGRIGRYGRSLEIGAGTGYFSRACWWASGFASTPVTRAARSASTAVP